MVCKRVQVERPSWSTSGGQFSGGSVEEAEEEDVAVEVLVVVVEEDGLLDLVKAEKAA